MSQSIMTTPHSLRVRRSFREVEKEHFLAIKNGTKGPTELEKLVTAWEGIQALDATDSNSFFMIAGYHGEPFRGVSHTPHLLTVSLSCH